MNASLFANDGVESVDGIGGVVDDSAGSIGFNEAVLSLDYISVTVFLLVLEVSGQTVLDVVSEGVLWVGVVFVLSEHGLGDGQGSSDRLDDGGLGVGNGGSGVGRLDQGSSSVVGSSEEVASVGGGQKGEESDELEKRIKK